MWEFQKTVVTIASEFSLERPLENIEKKKSASESNLLAAATSTNDIAPTKNDTGHSVTFIQKKSYKFPKKHEELYILSKIGSNSIQSRRKWVQLSRLRA